MQPLKSKAGLGSSGRRSKETGQVKPGGKGCRGTEKKDEQIAELQAKLLKSDLQKRQRHPWKRMVIRSAWLNCWIIPVKRLWKESVKINRDLQGKSSDGGGIQTSWKDSGGPWQCSKRRKYVKRSDRKKYQRIIRRI